MQQVSIFSLVTLEPMVVITNLLNTLICIVIFFKLNRFLKQNHQIKVYHWMHFFLSLGLSSFLGAIYHGYKSSMSQEVFYVIWFTSQIINCIAVYHAQAATIYSFYNDRKRKNIAILLIRLLLLVFVTLCIITKSFLVVKIDMIIGLTAVIVYQFKNYSSTVNHAHYVANGLVFSYLAAVVHSTKFHIGEWFDFNSIAHIIVSLSLIFMYLGIAKDALLDKLKMQHV